MSEPARKKSISSDSELSDGWSIVEHSDSAPLTLRDEKNLPQVHTCPQANTSQKVNPPEEASSDAESVEIIQEENINDFILPHNISRITKMVAGGRNEKQTKCESSDFYEDKELKQVSLMECASEYCINTGLYSNQWFRIFVFMSSLLAFFLLLISSTSLFFKVQAYSKSDGLIVVPDEDLSSLIADLALFKEENSRLMEELNMIKYEYGGSRKNDEGIDILSDDDDMSVGFQVISDGAQHPAEPKSFINRQAKVPIVNLKVVDKQDSVVEPVESGQRVLPSETWKDEAASGKEWSIPSVDGSPHKPLINLIHLEQEINKFASSIGINEVVVSCYNLTNNLNNIIGIVESLNSVIDRTNHNNKENKKHQLQQKLVKFNEKIQQEFKKSFEKVAKRINKFHDEFSQAYCRIKSGGSEVPGVVCNINGSNQRTQHNNNNKNKRKRNKVITSSVDSDSSYSSQTVPSQSKYNSPNDQRRLSNSQDNFKIRYKRNADSTDKKSKNNGDDLIKRGDSRNENRFDDAPRSNVYHHTNSKRNKPTSGGMKGVPNIQFKWDGKTQYFDKISSGGKHGRHNLDKINNIHHVENPDKTIKTDKCSRNKCHKRSDKDKLNVIYNKNEEAFMKIDNNGKNPSSKIHNESIYSKIVNNNAKRKAEINGEWYLDLGEIRNEKRLRRSVRDRSSWLFDRALVREWCRTNSRSSLCTSFAHSCDYCFF